MTSMEIDYRFHAAGLHAMPMVMAPPTAATTSRKNKSQRCSICGGLGRTPPPAARRTVRRLAGLHRLRGQAHAAIAKAVRLAALTASGWRC